MVFYAVEMFKLSKTKWEAHLILLVFALRKEHFKNIRCAHTIPGWMTMISIFYTFDI